MHTIPFRSTLFNLGRMLALLLLLAAAVPTPIFADAAMPPENPPVVEPPVENPPTEPPADDTETETSGKGGWFYRQFKVFSDIGNGIIAKIRAFFVEFWNLFSTLVESVFEWIIEKIYWIGDSCIKFLYYIFDSLVGMLVTIFESLVDMLPEIKFPSGFEKGLEHIMTYALLLNNIFPVKHVFICIGIYLVVMMSVGLVRVIVKFVPFIG